MLKRKAPSKPSRKPAAKPRVPHRATGKPRGQPPFTPTDEQRAMVKAAAGYRIPEDEICLVIINPRSKRPISGMTLRKHFADEIAQGYASLRIRIMAATVRNALGIVTQGPDGKVTVEREGNVTAQIWLQKTLYGAREHVDVVPPTPVQTEDEELITLNSARRVAFTMALGARIVKQKHPEKLKHIKP